MTPLRRRMEEELRLRGLSEKTVVAYLGAVRRFAEHFGASPDTLGSEEVRTFLVAVARERQWSWATANQALCGLKFFYRHVAGRPLEVDKLPFRKRKQPLPTVLSESEVTRLLSAPMSLKMRAVLMTLYSAALRLSEGTHLQPVDIDSAAMVIRIRQPKGGRDRAVMLSIQLLHALRAYWRVYRPGPWLFYGNAKERPLAPRSVQRAVRKAGEDAGITQRVTPHTLRHSCATHLLERGTSVRHIQELLGHRSIQTTLRYTRVSPQRLAGVVSPLDRLPLERLLDPD